MLLLLQFPASFRNTFIAFHVYAVFKVRTETLRFLTAVAASGDEGIRTLDPLLARQVLSQLSYTPIGYEIKWA